jgi:hypothetical protein
VFATSFLGLCRKLLEKWKKIGFVFFHKNKQNTSMEQFNGIFGDSYNVRQVSSLFGVSPETITILWLLFNQMELCFVLQPVHLLWALYFLKHYPTCDAAAHHWQCDVKTYRLYIWRVIAALFTYLDTVSVLFRENSL